MRIGLGDKGQLVEMEKGSGDNNQKVFLSLSKAISLPKVKIL